MAAITASMVKELREMSGAGMMDCKKALTETDGDFDKAVEFLREKGLATAVKVDGEDVATINADFTSGWGNYAKAQQIYSSDEVATHTVEVTVVDDTKPNFQILNWLIS